MQRFAAVSSPLAPLSQSLTSDGVTDDHFGFSSVAMLCPIMCSQPLGRSVVLPIWLMFRYQIARSSLLEGGSEANHGS